MTLYPTVIVVGIILGLIGVGVYCLLITRNMIKVVIGLQLMVKGAALAIILAGNVTAQMTIAQTMALTVIVADTIIAVVGLAFAVQIRQRMGTLDVKSLSSLKR